MSLTESSVPHVSTSIGEGENEQDEIKEERALLVQAWYASFKDGAGYDSWGQPVEAIEIYSKLSRQLHEDSSPESFFFDDSQKKKIKKIADLLDNRCHALKQQKSREDISLDSLKIIESYMKKILPEDELDLSNLGKDKKYVLVSQLSQHDVSLENKDCITTGNACDPSDDSITNFTVYIMKIGLKNAAQYIDPFITVSIKDNNGTDLVTPQDTVISSKKEDSYLHYGCDVDMQTPLDKLPQDFAIFFEFKHFKPKKKIISTKCWAFMERDEIKEGPAVVELYKKPTDKRRKNLKLFTVKPLYLHLKLSLN